MSGINIGILTNAYPLSTEYVNELEKQVIENNKAFAYLDEKSELCFAMPSGVETIKELAWDNAYELATQDDKLIKKFYKKGFKDSYYLKETLQKFSFEDAWEAFKVWLTVKAPDGKVPNNCGLVDLLTETEFLPGDDLPEFNTPFYAMDLTIEDIGITQTYLLLQKGFRTLEEARSYMLILWSFIDGNLDASELNTETFWQEFAPSLPFYDTIGTGLTEDTFVAANPTFFWSFLGVSSDRISNLPLVDGKYLQLNNIYCDILDFPVLHIYTLKLIDSDELLEVTIPNSMESIGTAAFYNCTSLGSIIIPDSVTDIGGMAFLDCTELNKVILSNNITDIKIKSFGNCQNLTSINLPNSLTAIGEQAFSYCRNLTSITIPDSVTSIGDEAFKYCDSLTNITIPDSIISIGDDAFQGTGYYNNSINWENNVLYINKYLIATDVNLSGSYAIKEGTKTIASFAFHARPDLTSINIPDSITRISDGTFYRCSGLTNITIPDSVTSIGYMAFRNCTSLTSITIPDSVTSIGERAFEYCTSLTSVTVGNAVTSIGDDAFHYCTSLTSITIPDSVTSIGDGAFAGCYGLTSIIFNGTTSQWNAISKDTSSWEGCPVTYIQCTDGQVAI